MGNGPSDAAGGQDYHLCDPSQILTEEQISSIKNQLDSTRTDPMSFVQSSLVKERLMADAKYHTDLTQCVAHFNDRDHLVHFIELLCGVDISDRDSQLTEEQLGNVLVCDAELFFQLKSNHRYFQHSVAGEEPPSEITAEERQRIVNFAGGFFRRLGPKLNSFCQRRAPFLGSHLGKLLLGHFSGSSIPKKTEELSVSSVVSDRVLTWMLHLLPFPSVDSLQEVGVEAWHLLYSSARDGHSMNGFVSHVTNYPGATVTLLRTQETDAVVGFYRVSEWKSSSSFSGESTNYLFSLTPELQCLASSGYSNNFAYFHVPSKTYTANILFDGIGIGGQIDHFRLSLDGDLKCGFSRKHGSTFDSDVNLLDKGADEVPFTVSVMEVWGLGGDDALAQRDNRNTKDKNMALNNRKVNRAQMAGAGPDQDMALLELAGAHKSYVKDADHV